jgi:hypothetical protein
MNGDLQKRQKTLDSVVASLEKKRKSRIFCIIHNAPPYHLCNPDMGTVINSRADFKGIDTLEILVNSPGGHAQIAYELATFFRNHCRTLNILVPIYATSAATLLCLNADKIIMGEFAHLGPIDVQLSDELEHGKERFSPLAEFKSMQFLREYAAESLEFLTNVLTDLGMSKRQALHEAIPGVAKMMEPLYSHVDPSRLGSYGRALAEAEEYAKRLLASVGNADAEDIAQKLAWEYPTHDFVIYGAEAKSLGLPVEIMDSQLEATLVKSMMGLIRDEISYSGFVEPPAAKLKGTKQSKLPTPAKSGATLAVVGGKH